jgi:hypothetical protein
VRKRESKTIANEQKSDKRESVLSNNSKNMILPDRPVAQRNSTNLSNEKELADNSKNAKSSANKIKVEEPPVKKPPATTTVNQIKDNSEIIPISVDSSKMTSFTIFLFVFMLFFLFVNFFKLAELEREISGYSK